MNKYTEFFKTISGQKLQDLTQRAKLISIWQGNDSSVLRLGTKNFAKKSKKSETVPKLVYAAICAPRKSAIAVGFSKIYQVRPKN